MQHQASKCMGWLHTRAYLEVANVWVLAVSGFHQQTGMHRSVRAKHRRRRKRGVYKSELNNQPTNQPYTHKGNAG